MKCVHKYIVKNIGTIFYTLNYEVKRALPLEVIGLMKDDLSGKIEFIKDLFNRYLLCNRWWFCS